MKPNRATQPRLSSKFDLDDADSSYPLQVLKSRRSFYLSTITFALRGSPAAGMYAFRYPSEKILSPSFAWRT